MSGERKKRIGPTEWRVSVPVGTYNMEIPIEVTTEGVEIDYKLFPWAELQVAKASADLRERKLAAAAVDASIQYSQRMTVAVEVKEGGVWRTTLHPSEAAARHFEAHTEHETRRVVR